MKRNPSQFYSHAGQLYGPTIEGGPRIAGSVDDLDVLTPARHEVEEGDSPRLDLTRQASGDSLEDRVGEGAKGAKAGRSK